MRSKKKLIIIALVIVIGVAGVLIAQQADNPAKNTQKATQVAAKTPAEITKDPKAYINKEIAVKGSLLQADPNTFIIADTPKNKTRVAAIRLDFSKSKLDPTQYIVSPSSPSPNAPTVSSPPKADTSEKTKKLAREAGAKSTEKPASILTIRGKLMQGKPHTPLVLIVNSIQ